MVPNLQGRAGESSPKRGSQKSWDLNLDLPKFTPDP